MSPLQGPTSQHCVGMYRCLFWESYNKQTVWRNAMYFINIKAGGAYSSHCILSD
jgi:hypothetical protein